MNDRGKTAQTPALLAEFHKQLGEAQAALFVHLTVFLSGNTELAREALQNADLWLCIHAGEWEPQRARLLTWAKKIAENEARKLLAKEQCERQRFPLLPEEIDALLELAESRTQEPNDALAALGICLRKLSRKDRKLLAERYAKNIPVAKLAERDKCTLSAMKMRLARLRSALGACVQDKLCRLDLGLYELPDETFSLLTEFPETTSASFHQRFQEDANFRTELLRHLQIHALLVFNAAPTKLRRNVPWKTLACFVCGSAAAMVAFKDFAEKETMETRVSLHSVVTQTETNDMNIVQTVAVAGVLAAASPPTTVIPSGDEAASSSAFELALDTEISVFGEFAVPSLDTELFSTSSFTIANFDSGEPTPSGTVIMLLGN